MSDQNLANESVNRGTESLRILEAVLFASDDLISTAKLKSILPDAPDARIIRKMVDEINIQLQKERHPFEIVELAGGYQFRTISYYQPWVQQVFKEKSTKKLSIQALECLAIIAYKQPITKSQIEFIRGVLSDGAMKTLLEKRLVTISGRSEKPGRPLLYGTTQDFLKYFGVNKIADLPNIEEFEAIAKEKMEEFTDEQLEEAGVIIDDKPEETESHVQEEGSQESINEENNPNELN
jgi:segregation and condensation protein B